MKADGSVIIDTKIIDGGMEKGFEQLKSKMNSVGVTAEKMGDKIKLQFSDGVPASVQEAARKLEELESKFESINAAYQEKLTISEALEKELAEVEAILANKGSEAVDIESYLEAYDKKDALKSSVENEKAAAAEVKSEWKSAYKEMEAARRRLTQVVVSETNREAKEQERAYRKATKAARSFGKRLIGVVSSALVFSLISRGLRQVTEYMGKALKTNKQFVETSNKMKGALLTAFQPLYETLLPAIISSMEVIAKYALVIGRFFASITGKSASQMQENASALYDQANATEEAGKAAKKASQQIGGFDELNVMQNQDTGGMADFNLESIDMNSKLTEMVTLTATALLAIGLLLTVSGVNIPLGLSMMALGAAGLYQSAAENWGAIIEAFQGPLGLLVGLLSGALLVAVGILLLGVSIPLGIAFIAMGAAAVATAVSANWSGIVDALQTPLGALIGLLAGAVLVVLGIILCCAQMWPLGIGLIVAGAAFLATTVSVNWNAIKEALQGPIGALVVLVSGALLVMGIMLCCAQIWPLGLGLIAAGATGLVTTVAVNWNALKEPIMSVIASILAILSGASLVIGVLMCLSGAGIPMGLALIFAGIKGTTAAWNLSNNPITRFVKNLANGIIGIINTIADAINDLFHIDFKGLKIAGVEVIPAFNAQLIRFPKIPMLAQGAVIPPNKEFMAVLGDQRNGTNIEAPLATIEEAVARVTGEQSERMVAALYTLIEIVEQKDLNVQIGDDDIGRANARYTQNRGVQVNTGAFANAY